MKRIILCLCFFIFIRTEAQQINPVPDYVFSNKMSVGRNAVTDTAAYFSIGPRYGAVRGFMPPMVTDTATITTGKRNGLTIFSIQKNKYMYWDSVRVRWSDFAGSSGAYIFASDTSSMLSPYIRAAGYGLTKSGQSLLVDTAAIATRARMQKAVDSINTNVALKVNISDTASMLTPYTRGSGTTNYLPKFTGSRTLGNSLLFDNGTQVGVNTNGPAYALDVNGTFRSVNGSNFATTSGQVAIGTATTAGKVRIAGDAFDVNTQTSYALVLGNPNTDYSIGADASYVYHQSWNSKAILLNNLGNNTIINPSSGSVAIGNTSPSYKLDITGTLRSTGNTFLGTSSSEVYVNTTTDAGAYALQVSGAIYNTTGAVLAASSGNVLIGSGSATNKLVVRDVTTSTAIVVDGGPVSSGIFSAQNNGTENGYLSARGDISSVLVRSRNWTMDVGTEANQALTLTTNLAERMRITSGGNVGIGTTAPSQPLHVNGNILTAAPSGGTAKPFKIGEAATVSPTSPNRTIRVEIDGTVYYIHAKTTND